MPSLAELPPATARGWIQRWDEQQTGYVPHREERFTALIDAVAAAAGRADPLVLDLGCGPGSLAVRLLDRLPSATVVAVDADPVLLTLGLSRPADAAVSTTALHWLGEDELAALYAELATVLRPGGVLVNGDYMADDEPGLARLGDALLAAERDRQYPAGQPENWADWWSAVLADPVLAAAAARREDRSRLPAHHTAESEVLGMHVAGLRAAGFGEIGTIWQHGGSRLLCAAAPS
jgi:SAM-dependent methyltransferase